MERTLILVKPDAFARNLTGEIIARFERKGLRLAALKQMTMTRELAERHYAEHDGKPFFGELVDVHHLRPAGRDGARGRPGDRGRAPGDRRDQPARGRARLDPRRLRDRGRPEHGPRLGLRPSRRRARSALFFPELAESARRADPRLALAAAAGDPRAAGRRVHGRRARRARSSSDGAAGRGRARERLPQGARRSRPSGTADDAARCSASTRSSRSARGSTASPPTRARRARRCGRSPGAATRWSAGCA